MSTARYRLVIVGALGPRYASAFDGMTVRTHDGETEITGPITDESHLQGLLAARGCALHPARTATSVPRACPRWEDAEEDRHRSHQPALHVLDVAVERKPRDRRCSGMVPPIMGRLYAIEAELEIPDDGAEGVIVADADFIGGFALWVDAQRKLHHTYSFLGVEAYKQVSDQPIPTGQVTVKMLSEADDNKPGTGGKVTIWAGEKQIGEGTIPRTVPVTFSSYAGMDISRDNGLVVDLDYEPKSPYQFSSPAPSNRSSSTSNRRRCTRTSTPCTSTPATTRSPKGSPPRHAQTRGRRPRPRHPIGTYAHSRPSRSLKSRCLCSLPLAAGSFMQRGKSASRPRWSLRG